MRISGFIARRLSIGGSNRTASVIAGAGVACALAVMLLTAAISLGFKHEIHSKLSGFMPQISLNAPYSLAGEQDIDSVQLSDDLRRVITQELPRASVSIALRGPGVIKTDSTFATQMFTAYGSGHDFAFERGNITDGEWLSGDTTMVISQTMARKLRLNVGDRVNTYFFIDHKLRARKLHISGIYASHFDNYDNTVCYVAPTMLQALQGWQPNTGTSIEINGIDDAAIDYETHHLFTVINGLVATDQLHTSLTIDNIHQSGMAYLSWLNLLDTNVVVIFALMSCVSALTLISSLFILILNNVETIGIFRTLGMPGGSIRGVFRRMAMRLVGTGMLFGNIFAGVILTVQHYLHVIPLNPEMYYLTYVPVEFSPLAWIGINIGAAVVAWLVILLPARLATSISVSSTLRYE